MAVGKKLRFEVFKRDSFTCQYCGRKAPDVLLEVDHIEPRSKGGSDDILNLATSCADCNRGKGPTELSDESVLAAKRNQLEDLQERQTQLQMMMEWQRSLLDLDTEAVEEAASFWCDLAGWGGITEEGKADAQKLIRRHGLEDILEAMRSATGYFRYDDSGDLTSESTEHAFQKIGAIARIKIAEQDNPWLKELFYTRGIVRNRMYCNDRVAKEILEEAYALGIPTEASRKVALNARNWTKWKEEMYALIEEAEDAVDG